MNKRVFKLVPRGFLKFYILKTLKNGPIHGYEIMVSMEEETGWKPSPGAIYPTLHKLKRRGLVREVKDEKTISYELTPKGLELTNMLEQSRDEMIRMFRKFVHVMAQIIGMKESELNEVMDEIEMRYKGRVAVLSNDLAEILPELGDLIIEKVKSKKNHEKVKEILIDTMKRLEMVDFHD